MGVAMDTGSGNDLKTREMFFFQNAWPPKFAAVQGPCSAKIRLKPGEIGHTLITWNSTVRQLKESISSYTLRNNMRIFFKLLEPCSAKQSKV